jgi:hypothetical protein
MIGFLVGRRFASILGRVHYHLNRALPEEHAPGKWLGAPVWLLLPDETDVLARTQDRDETLIGTGWPGRLEWMGSGGVISANDSSVKDWKEKEALLPRGGD